MKAEQQLPVPLIDIGRAVSPLQEDQRDGQQQDGGLEQQADREREAGAAALLETNALFEPAPDRRTVIGKALREPVNPKQQQIDQRQDRSGDDQLLRQETREREVASERTHHDG